MRTTQNMSTRYLILEFEFDAEMDKNRGDRKVADYKLK